MEPRRGQQCDEPPHESLGRQGERFHHQWMPDEVLIDLNGLEPATVSALEAMGHTFKRIEKWGSAEAVMVDPVTNLRSAGSDPRNEGAALGQD